MLKKLKLNGSKKTYKAFYNYPQKTCPFHSRGLECKSRKSKIIWSNRQIWSWSTEWSRAKANRVFPRECTCHSKHPLPTTQEKTLHTDIIRWSTPKSDRLYFLQPKMEKLNTVCKIKTGSWLWLRGPKQTLENSSRDGNTRPPDLPFEKSVCRSGSNS